VNFRNVNRLGFFCISMLLVVPSGAQTNDAQQFPFDGTWDVIQECPETSLRRGAEAASRRFQATILKGIFSGSFREFGSPGSFQLAGTIDPSGKSWLTAKGYTGNAKNNVNRSVQAEYHSYPVKVSFTADKGSGDRTEGRVCRFEFTRIPT
jgi:hypothetical protein